MASRDRLRRRARGHRQGDLEVAGTSASTCQDGEHPIRLWYKVDPQGYPVAWQWREDSDREWVAPSVLTMREGPINSSATIPSRLSFGGSERRADSEPVRAYPSRPDRPPARSRMGQDPGRRSGRPRATWQMPPATSCARPSTGRTAAASRATGGSCASSKRGRPCRLGIASSCERTIFGRRLSAPPPRDTVRP